MTSTDRTKSTFGDIALAAILVFSAIGQYAVANAQAAAQISTDKSVYTTGDIVIITGTGFLPDSTIDLSITHPDYNIVSWKAMSDENGGFETTYQLDAFAETYTITATDGLSTATTTFSAPGINII